MHGRCCPRRAPGFWNSNIGYLFVRQIIERATNADLNDALRILVFDPLGIKGVFVAGAVEEFDAIVWETRSGMIRDGSITDASSARCRGRPVACIV